MRKGLKILIIALVASLIAGVYFYKNAQTGFAGTAGEERIPLEYTLFDMEEFLSPGLPLLLDLGSASCGPCVRMKPDLEAFYDETYGKVSVRYADVWANPELSGGFPAYAVPVQYFFYADGTPYVPSENIESQISFYFFSYSESSEHALTAHFGMMSKDEMYMILRDMGADI